jgi:hypothetical protein
MLNLFLTLALAQAAQASPNDLRLRYFCVQKDTPDEKAYVVEVYEPRGRRSVAPPKVSVSTKRDLLLKGTETARTQKGIAIRYKTFPESPERLTLSIRQDRLNNRREFDAQFTLVGKAGRHTGKLSCESKRVQE